MSKAPAFQWFKIQLVQVSDDLMDVKDPASEGIYFRVLRWLWSNGPQTMAEIQRKCKASFGELEHVFSACSTDVEPLFSIRWIEDQREKAETGREKWQKAGLASAEARRAKSKKKNKRSTNEEQTLNECSTDVEHSTSTSYSISSEKSGKKEHAGAKSIAERIEAFAAEVRTENAKRADPLPEAEVVKFIAYWTQAGPNDRRFHAEKQQTFGTAGRLITWSGNVRQGAPSSTSKSATARPMDRNAPIETDMITRRS